MDPEERLKELKRRLFKVRVEWETESAQQLLIFENEASRLRVPIPQNVGGNFGLKRFG